MSGKRADWQKNLIPFPENPDIILKVAVLWMYSFNSILNIFVNLFDVVFKNLSKKIMLIFTLVLLFHLHARKGNKNEIKTDWVKKIRKQN